MAILYGTQFSIKLGIFPRYFSKGMSSQQALMVPGCRLLQPSNNIDLLMLSRHEAKIKKYIYIKKLLVIGNYQDYIGNIKILP